MFGRLFARKGGTKSSGVGLDGQAAIDAVRPALEKVYTPLKRTAFVPVVETGGDATRISKFNGGSALLQQGEDWPCCPDCSTPFSLFVQLELDRVPEPLKGKFGPGVLQLFYCSNYDCPNTDDWEPFDFRKKTLRILSPEADTELRDNPHTAEAKYLTGWEARDDYPALEESTAPDIQISGRWDQPGTLSIPSIGYESPLLSSAIKYNVDTSFLPIEGEKMGGWPYWVQGAEYPHCPTCGQTMQMVFQIDSEKLIDYMFGDVGVGHIMQCPDHKDSLGFGWACH